MGAHHAGWMTDMPFFPCFSLVATCMLLIQERKHWLYRSVFRKHPRLDYAFYIYHLQNSTSACHLVLLFHVYWWFQKFLGWDSLDSGAEVIRSAWSLVFWTAFRLLSGCILRCYLFNVCTQAMFWCRICKPDLRWGQWTWFRKDWVLVYNMPCYLVNMFVIFPVNIGKLAVFILLFRMS